MDGFLPGEVLPRQEQTKKKTTKNLINRAFEAPKTLFAYTSQIEQQ